MDARCRIELFGWLRVVQDGRVITRFQTRPTGALLAFLAFHSDRSHPRDVLMGIAWPEDQQYTDRHKLRVALSSLRRQLEPPSVSAGTVIVADRSTVQLNPAAVTTDVASFETTLQAAARAPSSSERQQRLGEAVALYRGELLPGYFEEWIVPERQRLAEAYLQALAQLARHLEKAGDLPRAIDSVRRAVAADPLREETRHELIRLLSAAGQLDAARQQYRELERLLAKELGDAPTAVSQDLMRRIERQPGPVYHGAGGTEGAECGPGPRETRGEPKTEDDRPSVSPSGATTCPAASPSSHAGEPLPTGTVTFLLVEFEGMSASEASREILRSLCLGHGGREAHVTVGRIVMAFGRASEALAAAVAGMEHLSRTASSVSSEQLPDARHARRDTQDARPNIPRMALDTGEVEPGDPPHRSPAVEHARRLLPAAHPGQILLSEKSAALLKHGLAPGLRLADRGRYSVHAEAPPEHLFQVEGPEGLRREFPPPLAAPAHVASLPLQLTRFFGREAELERLRALLLDERRRLVTLTGPGGGGKTRLAVELVAGVRKAFCDAVWYVPLADLSDPGFIPEKLLEALGQARLPGVEPIEQVVEFLSSARFVGAQPLLLIMDNFEQLAPHGAALLETLLQRVETLTLLVTSRHRLDLAGEREFAIAPLPTPPPAPPRDREGWPKSIAPVLDCASVRLFVDRAQAVRPDFQVTKTNAGSVAALCARLEGLPLAIELAAARAQVLTPAQMLSRLEQRFDLLTSRQRGREPRHQSLRAALDWSYQLLSPPLRQFFARLSVFRGGWTAAAAEAICEATGATDEGADNREPGPGAALDYLAQLRSYSLVLLEEGEGEMRFRLLESLREYGAEQLSPEERSDLARRHADYYTRFAERAELKLKGPEQIAWLNRLEAEHPNFRAALAGSLEADGSIDTALRLCTSLQPFWNRRQHDREGLHWVERALEVSGTRPGPTEARRAMVLASAGDLAETVASLEDSPRAHERARAFFDQGLTAACELGDRLVAARCLTGLAAAARGWRGWHDHQVDRQLHEQALAIYQELQDKPGVTMVLNQLALMAYHGDDEEWTRRLAEEGLSMARELGDRWRQLMPLGILGQLAHRRGDLALARELLAERLLILGEIGGRYVPPQVFNHLGQLAFDQGDDRAAQSFYEQGVRIARETGSHRFDLALGLCGLGDVARRRGESAGARSFHAECWPIFRELGYLRGAVHSLNALGEVARLAGDPGAARASLRESLILLEEWRDEAKTIECLEELAELLVSEGHGEPAAQVLAAAEALQGSMAHDPRPTPGHPRYPHTPPESLARRLREAFPAAWAGGRALPLQEAISAAWRATEPPGGGTRS